MPNIGPLEIILVILVILLLFGSTKLPKLARSMGEASKEFKKGIHEPVEVEPPPVAAAKAEPAANDNVTMSRAELDALLAEREAQSRKEAPPTA